MPDPVLSPGAAQEADLTLSRVASSVAALMVILGFVTGLWRRVLRHFATVLLLDVVDHNEAVVRDRWTKLFQQRLDETDRAMENFARVASSVERLAESVSELAAAQHDYHEETKALVSEGAERVDTLSQRVADLGGYIRAKFEPDVHHPPRVVGAYDRRSGPPTE